MMVLSSQSVLHTAYSAQIQGIRSRALAYRRQRYIKCLTATAAAARQLTDPKPFVGLHRVDFTAEPGRPLFSRAADKGAARMYSASLRVTAISEEKLFMQLYADWFAFERFPRPNIQNAAPNSDHECCSPCLRKGAKSSAHPRHACLLCLPCLKRRSSSVPC